MLPENVEFNRLLSTSNSLRGSKSTVCLRETLTLIINLFDNDFLNTVNDFLDTVKNPHRIPPLFQFWKESCTQFTGLIILGNFL